MVQFSRLRIHGFKSFVEKTELDIGPGMNGVVGPNGCGKSNLVEALRWVMGENSPKRMRGAGMEDVIFNGTDRRSARNIAEVSILLDNSDRQAPAAYNGQDSIEIVRRIERDKGSNYRINGKVVRARDVQMFFADSVSGANSPAMVSQGRVTEIIKAKPMERRLILEDSAGISGLFVRRHEAELKLRAADNNLGRLDDLLGSMQSRLSQLKRQAQQAQRYKDLSEKIRKHEIALAFFEYLDAQEKLTTSKRAFATAETQVAESLAVVTQLTKTQNTQSQDLPALRQGETKFAAILQNHRVALQRQEDDEARRAAALTHAKADMDRLLSDQAHETDNLQETESILTRLDVEHGEIVTAQPETEKLTEEKLNQSNILSEEVKVLDEAYSGLMQNAAEKKARLQSLQSQKEQNQKRLETLETRYSHAQETLRILQQQDSSQEEQTQLESAIEAMRKTRDTAQQRHDDLQKRLPALRADKDKADIAAREAEQKLSGINAQIDSLEALVSTDGDQQFSVIRDLITPQSGFESALSRALGDSLMASLDQTAPIHWRAYDLSDLPALPNGCTALVNKVNAPDALKAALSQIGYVEDMSAGDAIAAQLKPGQALVGLDGTYWRWDGLYMACEAADRNAIYLEQKNKLSSLLTQRPPAEQTLVTEQERAEKIAGNLKETSQALDEANMHLRASERELGDLQLKLSALNESRAGLIAKTKAQEEQIIQLEEDLKTLRDVLSWDQERLDKLQDQGDSISEEHLDQARRALNEKRDLYNDTLRAYERAVQQQGSLQARLRAIADERVNVKNRNIRAREHLKTLSDRQGTLKARLDELSQAPIKDEGQREALLEKITAAETQRNEAAEALSKCEREVYETGRALKEAETTLNLCREERAGAQANASHYQESLNQIIRRIEENFSMPPAELQSHVSFGRENTDSETLRREKESLIIAREKIGPVNLRAEAELAELENEVGGMLSERDELTDAIAELRGGIQTINKEARERLRLAFDQVNTHFQRLFQQLFVGGQAHLALVGSDDPLEAGLEIFAQPPGKALQSLSLLSGGEQTMASIALIFAMFLTNPSPICVLDEIDAPLDDSNVDRVCNLLETIAARGETRFMVITHHRLTMARMDRLYGVTMQEKGISQLVSVDLQKSFEFAEAA